MKFIFVIVLVIVIVTVLILVIVREFITSIVIVLVICHSILLNLEIKGDHENYAFETSL